MATKDVQLRLLISAVNQAGSQLSGLGTQLSAIAAKTKAVSDQTSKLGEAGSAGLSKFSEGLDALKTKMEGIVHAGDSMVNIGSQLALAGGALLGAAVFPIATAGAFERQMATVLAVTTNAADQLDEMKEKAKELGRSTRFTATQAAEGMVMLGRAGFTATQVITGIGPALNLAVAGSLDLAKAADIATNVLGGMKLPVEQLTRVANTLATTANATNSTVEELGEGFSYVAADAEMAGLDLEETAAILGIFHDVGIKATRSGTALRAVLTRLRAPIGMTQKAFDELNVRLVLNENGTVNIMESLKVLMAAQPTATQMVRIFGQSWAGAADIMESASAKITSLTKANKENTTAAADTARIMEDNLYGSVTNLKSALEGLLIAVGEPLLKPLSKIILGLAEIVRGMVAWAEANPKVGSTIAVIVGTIGGLAFAVGAVLVPLGLMVRAIGAAGLGLVQLAPFFAPVIAGLRSFAGAAYAAATAGSLLSSAFIALAAAWGAFQIYNAVGAFIEWRKAAAMAAESQKRLIDQSTRLIGKFEDMKDYRLPEGFAKAPSEELNVFRARLSAAQAYFMSLKNVLLEKTKEKSWLFFETEQAKAAGEELKTVAFRLKQIAAERAELAKVMSAKPVEDKPDKPVQLTDDEQKRREKALEDSEKLRIELIADTAKKLAATRDAEIKEFKEGEEAKVLSAAEAEDRIRLIRSKYGKQIAEANLEAEKEAVEKARQLREAASAVDAKGIETQLRQLEDAYDKELVGQERFLQERRSLKMKAYDSEIAELKQKIAEELDPDKKRFIEFELKLAEVRKADEEISMDIDDDAMRKQKLDAERNFQDELSSLRKSVFDDTNMKAAQDEELALMKSRFDQQLQMFRDAKIEEAEIAEMAAEQQKLILQKQVDNERQALEMRRDATVEILGNMSQTLSDLYATSGEEVKAFFYLQKAVSAAEAMISAYSAANKVLDSPIAKLSPTLAMALSASIMAAGMARVGMIAATTIRAAEGGWIKIPKKSPVAVRGFAGGGSTATSKAPSSSKREHPAEILVRTRELGAVLSRTRLPTTTRSGIVRGPKGKDVIPAWLTDNEYVMNPKAVSKYGVGFMEALNRRLVDVRDVMAPTIRLSRTAVIAKQGVPIFRAEGGPVSSSSGGASGAGRPVASGQGAATPSVNIVNVVDSSLMDQYLSSSAGQKIVLNILSANQPAAQRAIMGRT